MSDMISIEVAREALLNKGQSSKRYKLGETWELNWLEIEDALSGIPTIDAEPVKHGHWIFKEKEELVPTGEFAIAEGYHIHYSHGAIIKPGNEGIVILKKHRKTRKPYCSECGEHGDSEQDATPFCPNCGAKMDGGADNER